MMIQSYLLSGRQMVNALLLVAVISPYKCGMRRMEAILTSIMGTLRQYLPWAGRGMGSLSPQQASIERCKCGELDEVPMLYLFVIFIIKLLSDHDPIDVLCWTWIWTRTRPLMVTSLHAS